MKLTQITTLALLAVVLGGCLSQQTSISGNQAAPNPNPGGNGNRAPTISGAPASAIVIGDTYSFTPNASDADGDSLSFSIENKPDWAQFDTSTGSLTGQPLMGDEGVYDNILISVTDGSADTDLPEFSIEVTQVALGSITLNWTPPTQNEDGSSLTDLAGYKLHFGTSSGNYTHHIRLDNPGISSYVIENLVPDTYYIAATAFNQDGIESDYSNEAVKTVSAM